MIKEGETKMKKTIVLVIMVLMLLAGFTTAQAMHDSEPNQQNLMKSMQLKLQHMNELLGILSDRLSENMPEDQRKEIAAIMKEISQGMEDLADIIRSGKVTEEQLERLNERLMELRMRIDKLFKPSVSAT